MLIMCYFVFYPQTALLKFYCIPPPLNISYPTNPIYLLLPIHPMFPLFLLHLMHPFYLLFLLSHIHPMFPLYPIYRLLTITTTAPNIRMIPRARLSVNGSPNTRMPMSTAVSGSSAPRMAVAVEPTYLAA